MDEKTARNIKRHKNRADQNGLLKKSNTRNHQLDTRNQLTLFILFLYQAFVNIFCQMCAALQFSEKS
jgi:hypothetical protein